MVPAWAYVVSIFLISVHGNIEAKYCEMLEEYHDFKGSMDNFLASRDEVCEQRHVRKDCASIKDEFPDATDGVYRIRPGDGKPTFLAYCDMTEQGGGWMVIQRRQDGSENFDRTWFEYMDGFGNLTGEFWLGNDKIHRLTNQNQNTLRIDLEDAKGKKTFAEYSDFRIGSMSEFYKLSVGGYYGNASDQLAYHKNGRFSAWNLDLDAHTSLNCAQYHHGGWWFKNCAYSSLNGRYNDTNSYGIYWRTLSNSKKTTMKIRPVQ